jgi:hypothetical protein
VGIAVRAHVPRHSVQDGTTSGPAAPCEIAFDLSGFRFSGFDNFADSLEDAFQGFFFM